MHMDLFDIEDARRMSREEAAARLHTLADALAQNNSVEFYRAGKRIIVRVPDQINLKVEVELGNEGENELEVELTW
jgi:amphi-Trp domain-containing protein